MILSLEDAKALLPQPPDDAALQLLLDQAEALIRESLVSETVEATYRPRGPLLGPLPRPVGELLRITEAGTLLSDYEDAYRVRPSGTVIVRLPEGRRWSSPVTVSYVPATPEDGVLEAAQLSLVKLELNSRPGIAAQSLGPWSETYATNAETERAAILASLVGGFEGIA